MSRVPCLVSRIPHSPIWVLDEYSVSYLIAAKLTEDVPVCAAGAFADGFGQLYIVVVVVVGGQVVFRILWGDFLHRRKESFISRNQILDEFGRLLT